MSWGEYKRLRLLGLSRDEVECYLFRACPWAWSVVGCGDE